MQIIILISEKELFKVLWDNWEYIFSRICKVSLKQVRKNLKNSELISVGKQFTKKSKKETVIIEIVLQLQFPLQI